jgi:S1-C subfamily serine protease
MIIYICVNVLAAPTTYAAGVPGGNIADPAVRGVDIAKPAVVRIATTLRGHLAVSFAPTVNVTFPQFADSYKISLLGSGAFISARGDILTADHVVQPSNGATDQILYQVAAEDVAAYYNKLSNQFVTANDVFVALTNRSLRSQSQYDQPTSKVYLSTDFTGPTDLTSLDAMPRYAYADVDRILKAGDIQKQDLAIIHVPINDTPSIKLGDSTNVESQDELTVIGFPGNADVPSASDVATRPNPATGYLTASVNKVYVSALKKNASGVPLIQVGGNVEHGDSGGPALDSNGNIVGVASLCGLETPGDTCFFQTSNSAQQLINDLQLNTQPGPFQSAWSQAFAEYSSSQPGHWYRAQQKLQELQSNYPNFHAIRPFLDYATGQASKETATSPFSSNNLPLLIGIALLALAVIFALVLLPAQRKKRRQAALARQSPYYGARPSPDSEQVSPSGSMARIDLKDGAEQMAGTTADSPLVQSRAMQSPPLVPQTPIPVAAYNTPKSGPLSTYPPPMNPWAQSTGVPVYGQPVPYGQQPYNTASQPRPVQGAPYPAYPAQPPYPAQQQPYMPYPLVPATPWPPVQGNTPQPPTPAPYAAQNPAQQGVSIQHGQQNPAYGAPYNQPPQGYGAGPAQPRPVQPAQSSQQSSESISVPQRQAPAPLIPDAATTSDEPTVRAGQRSTSTSEEIVKPGEDKKITASSIPALSKDDIEIKTHLGEQDAQTELGEK